MKIEICGGDAQELILSDEDLDNNSFVDVIIGDSTATVCIRELMAAATAFDELKTKHLKDEDLYKL